MSEKEKSIYGIIGHPVAHSLSPLMHNAAFKELKLNAEYRLFPLEEKELDAFFKGLREKNSPIFGFNVTVPYKEKVLQYMDLLSPYAQKAKAVNTVVIDQERNFHGFNTDGPGFLAHLAELQFDTMNKKIAVLGAGGTARAILAVLCLLPERPAWIKIYNRHKEKADILVDDLKERLEMRDTESVGDIEALNIPQADLLVNTTPVGLKPDDPSLVDERLLHSGLLVYDMIYNPPETKLLKWAKSKKARTANGLGMLFFQGVLAFQHWAGSEIGEKVKQKMRASLEGALT